MTMVQLELPLFPTPCPVFSFGEPCRYYAGHLERGYDHTFGGGLCDPIEKRHCPRNNWHEPHAWPPGKPEYACSGDLTAVFCADDQRIHLPHGNCPGRDHIRCELSLAGELHEPHSFEDRKHAWWCHGQKHCGRRDLHSWHSSCPGTAFVDVPLPEEDAHD